MSWMRRWLRRNQYHFYLVEEALNVLKGIKQKINLEEIDAKMKSKFEEIDSGV